MKKRTLSTAGLSLALLLCLSGTYTGATARSTIRAQNLPVGPVGFGIEGTWDASPQEPDIIVTTAAELQSALSPANAGAQAGQQEVLGAAKSQGGRLEGTWRVQVTLRDCQTGAELRPPAPALLTFAKGGTLTETTTVFPPAVRSPGHGFWRHTGGQTYTAVSEAFIFNPGAPPASAWVGTQRLTQTIQLGDDSDELTSTASTVFFGPDGNPIPGFPPVPGCATAVARRME